MVKTICKLLSFVAIVLVATATVIKFVQKVSYKEAVGIMEELCKEMAKNCCCRRHNADETAPEV